MPLDALGIAPDPAGDRLKTRRQMPASLADDAPALLQHLQSKGFVDTGA
jgi:hypothetical protein